jgi:hypothetical protein
MQFPSDWSDRKRNSHPDASTANGCGGGAVSKRRKVSSRVNFNETTDDSNEELKTLISRCEAQHALKAEHYTNPDYDDSIVGTIKRQINNNRFAPATPEELQLDHVLSSVPYRDMLESLFGTVSGQVPNLPIITKAYEESFMRETFPGERQCAMGSKCECMFIDQNAPFICVEFDLPSEEAPAHGAPHTNFVTKASSEPKLCVLCSRKTTQKLFYDACYSGRRTQGLIQRYGNLCNQPGEYARECMLICPPNAQWNCLPLPIMSHQRNRYRVQVIAGVKHLQQLRVSYEDFFVTPSGSKAQA